MLCRYDVFYTFGSLKASRMIDEDLSSSYFREMITEPQTVI